MISKVNGIKVNYIFCHGVYYLKIGFKYKNIYNETEVIKFSACYGYQGFTALTNKNPITEYNIDQLNLLLIPKSNFISHLKKYNLYLSAFIRLINNPPILTREEAYQYIHPSIKDEK